VHKIGVFLGETVEASQITVLSDGFCNDVFRVRTTKGFQVVKFYSLVSKLRTKSELRGFADVLCAQLQLSPSVTACTPSGIAHEFILGRVLSEKDMHKNSNDFGLSIASRVSTLHNSSIPREYGSQPLIWSWLSSMLEYIKFEKKYLPGGVTVYEIEEKVASLKRRLEDAHLPVVFCHGDLKPSNLLLEESTRHIWMIDLELAGPNYRGFDLMKLFRTNPQVFSHAKFERFLSCYVRQLESPQLTVHELKRECQICESLAWLEAAVFFAAMVTVPGSDVERNAALFESRWQLFLGCEVQC
jgi:thiamine kinase-like enzyme